MATMRRIAILAGFLLACAAEDPPPGTLIGTFDFVATLEPEGTCILEDVAGFPTSFEFSAILSHEVDGGKLWLRSGATQQTGSLDENTFTVRTPSSGGGIPRSFDACTVARRKPCPFLVTEQIEAAILSDCPVELAQALEGSAEEEPQAQDLPCPEVGEDGRILWHNCVCARGRLEEIVRFDPEGDEVCTCVGRTRTEPFEGSCTLVYRLEGEKR